MPRNMTALQFKTALLVSGALLSALGVGFYSVGMVLTFFYGYTVVSIFMAIGFISSLTFLGYFGYSIYSLEREGK